MRGLAVLGGRGGLTGFCGECGGGGLVEGNEEGTLFAAQVGFEAGVRPIFGFQNQASIHWVAVDISDLFDALGLGETLKSW